MLFYCNLNTDKSEMFDGRTGAPTAPVSPISVLKISQTVQ